MMICAKCGHENADGSNFCAQCGERLSTASDTTSVIPAIDEDSAPHAEISAEDSAAVHALPAGHALLVVTRGPDVGARYLLDQPVTLAGRSPDCDIFLDDITVSRHHAKFTMGEEGVTITDLGSLNGTYVNRTLVDGSALLRPGEEVQIGKFRMVFFVSELGLR
ncbi:MAG: FHA domain-containing protein [Propionibacterium acidifaciens]|uniref:Oxoglutarate dehydrogenase inhibitor n=1 Tax=Propionibacterium acidifaciens F0233 TaxID=553198 RepID=U2R7E1_9ACTN|nr:FHA domain-containing protein [Propionibacterium acidifaciens]AYW76848.1 FHA domain-containing protein [Propionibacterium acidifaciens]ERK49538.1 putative oxoglutarate dehydrogenase inhibitor [Propionibacterium acidifaciens F0233]